VVVRGAVQGVGFRPFVHRLATALELAGWVHNSAQGVFIEVEGPRGALQEFLLRLEAERPPHSFIQSLESRWLDPVGYAGFVIRESQTGGEPTALVLPDIATCPDCLREIFDPANRRYRYPFTNCTHCGPRFSILTALPYDRANTTMARFAMCPACRAEYEDPANRRFHAQPNACPVCGPQLELRRGGARPRATAPGRAAEGDHRERGDAALRAAAEALRRGEIVAVKGLGGFHLMALAQDEAAVRRLRARKQREEKPLALMFPSLQSVRSVCLVSPWEERLLRAPEAPIVLLQRRPAADDSDARLRIAPSVAPGNPLLGVLLPYTPLHHLLLAEVGCPVVATSGNRSDEPICTDEEEAQERLGDIADVFLVHDRPIARHVDDSVVRVVLGRELILRRARGYAPLPVGLSLAPGTPPAATVLGVGAQLKNTVALARGAQVFVSQHIGDLDTAPAHAAFRRVIADFQRLYAASPEVIAADLHPDYLSTQFAAQLCGARPAGAAAAGADAAGPGGAVLRRPEDGSPLGRPRLCGVQHHLAHVLACMAENELTPPVLGVAWDGTGYGPDGTVWGGEFLRVTEQRWQRVAHWRAFRLPGGEAAVRQPRRAALGVLYELFGPVVFAWRDLAPLRAFSAAELAVLHTMLARGLNAPWTTSVGRLFDAVAALAGVRQVSRFEGQAAMELEFAREGVETDACYDLPPPAPSLPWVLDWGPLIRGVVQDARAQLPPGGIAARAHNTLVEAIVQVAQRGGERRVVLTGGCFQNRYLTEQAVARLQAAGFQPYWHQRVPPNDGGIALGQVVAARAGLREE